MTLKPLDWALLALSVALAAAYGVFGEALYASESVPHLIPVALKTSGIALLGLIALMHRSRLLAAALLFGSLGDALLAWSEDAFLYGALAFVVGHLFYIALFWRVGVGVSGLKREPVRVVPMLAIAGPSIALNTLLVPSYSALYIPLLCYSLVLTVMTISSFTLPWSRWLAMAGAVLFLISDGFVAAHVFRSEDPIVADFWFGFAGWMIYWAAQAGLCIGALGLHKRA